MRIMFVCILLINAILSNAQTTRVLFIGNSYTGVNDLPNTFKSLSLSLGDSVFVQSNTPGGYTFNGHSTNPTTLSLITQGNWDFVVLQEQSQLPSFSPIQVEQQCFPFAALLDSIIDANNTCSETVFYMTWGRKNGDASNCANYPVICTYEGMQGRLRESYLQMAIDNEETVAPVGMAWKYVRDNYPNIELYSSDESHPSMEGTYLTACVFYSSLFHKPTSGASYRANLDSLVALNLQNSAFKVVNDSLQQWQENGQLVYAEILVDSFNTTPGVSFQDAGWNANNWSWTFGDGQSGSGFSPFHSYTENGSFQVVLTASNACFSATDTQTISVLATSINESKKEIKLLSFENHLYQLQGVDEKNELALFDLYGRKIMEIGGSQHFSLADLNQGIYYLRLIDKGNFFDLFRLKR